MFQYSATFSRIRVQNDDMKSWRQRSAYTELNVSPDTYTTHFGETTLCVGHIEDVERYRSAILNAQLSDDKTR